MRESTTVCIGEKPSIDPERGCAVTIGNFDGVHKGHQTLIQHTIEFCRKVGIPSVVLTFWPHPRCVIGKEHIPIVSRETRRELLLDMRPDWIWEIPFSRSMANLKPEEFVRQFLAPISMRRLIVGRDFSLGKGRTGMPSILQSLGRAYGYTVEQIAPMTVDGAVVSSSRIRHFVEQGGVDSVVRMLGRPHFVEGIVERGQGRGASLGVPTANQAIPDLLMPMPGVYVTQASFGDHSYGAVTNIGSHPTFGSGKMVMETHLLDAPSTLDIYGQKLRIAFLSHLRAEKRFANADELIKQIHQDIATAQEVLQHCPAR